MKTQIYRGIMAAVLALPVMFGDAGAGFLPIAHAQSGSQANGTRSSLAR